MTRKLKIKILRYVKLGYSSYLNIEDWILGLNG